MDDPSRYGSHVLLQIPLVTFHGILISKSDYDICFEINIKGNTFRRFFPLTQVWLNYNEHKECTSIDVHKWLALRMGLIRQ